MKLFYKPGACSLASHIILNEIGAAFEIEEVNTETGQTSSGRDFKQINPKGYVPALELNSGEILTEGASILQYIADQNLSHQLAPAVGTLERTRVQEYLNYTSAELHKAFGPLFSSNSTDAEKDQARVNVGKKFDYVTTLFNDGREYLVDNKFSVADAYLFVVINWANFVGVDLPKWPVLQDYVSRIMARPAVQKSLAEEGLL